MSSTATNNKVAGLQAQQGFEAAHDGHGQSHLPNQRVTDTGKVRELQRIEHFVNGSQDGQLHQMVLGRREHPRRRQYLERLVHEGSENDAQQRRWDDGYPTAPTDGGVIPTKEDDQ